MIISDEMKEYNCYTPKNRENSKDLRCGVAVAEDEKCEEICRTADTVTRRDTSPGSNYNGLVVQGTQLCEISESHSLASTEIYRRSPNKTFQPFRHVARAKPMEGTMLMTFASPLTREVS